jgi:hypothetical protein
MQTKRRTKSTPLILLSGLLLLLLTGGLSQLLAGEVEETGLHSYAAMVIGEDISGQESLETEEAYLVTAEGDVTEDYTDASVSARGIYSDASGMVALTTGGDVGVTATGGATLGVSSLAVSYYSL